MQGKEFPAECRSYTDSVSGRTVTQLTDYFGHSCHLYFTNNSFYGDTIVYRSHRDNRNNLFQLDLTTMVSRQLSDFPDLSYEERWSDRSQNSYVHQGNGEVYAFYGHMVYGICLETLRQRVLYEAPQGYLLSSGSPSSDGKYVLCSINEEVVKRDSSGGGFYEFWAAFPKTQIIRIQLETGEISVIYEEDYWIKHINMSPTVPNLMTFCHEGPWDKVDHRIWSLDIDSGRCDKVVTDHGPNKTTGHEYWFQDGKHLGYHGTKRGADGKYHGYFGSIRYDNAEQFEVDFPFRSHHFHSNDFNLIVGDGTAKEVPYILLWQRDENVFAKPRILAFHGSSTHVQMSHVHPCFTPDGSRVLFTSDVSGYANIYLVEVGDVAELPFLEER